MHIKCGKDYGLISSLLFIILYSVQIQQVLSQLSAKIQSSSTIINSTCNHILTVTFANTQIPTGSSLLMQYSNTWTLTSISGGNTGDFCQTSCNISNIIMTPNSVARTAQIKNLFTRIISAGESRTIRYTIKNIINPSYALTQNVIISLLDNTASLIDLTVASVTASARSISCTVSRTSTVVSTSGEYIFTINPSPLTIPSSTSILMIFPSTWFNSAQPGTYNSSTTTCKSSATVLTSCPQTNGNLNVTNFITASTTASFSFNATNIKNPGSDELNNQLLLQFYSSGNLYAICYAPITGTTARTIPDLSISMPGSLGDVITGMINFTITELSKTTDIVQIQLPLAYDCSILYTAFVYLNNQTVNRQSIINVKTNSTMNYITLQPFFTSSIALYRIQLYNIQLPKTSATISQIKLSIIRNGALLASQTCCSTSYSNISSSSGIVVTLSNSGVGMLSTHYITITNSSAFLFPNDYTYILIQFDATKYSLSNPTYTCYIKDTLSIIYPITCTRNSSTSILISNLATNNQSFKISATLFTIGIDAVLTPVTLSSLSLSLALLDPSYNLVQNVTTTYSLVATKINNVSVSTGDSTTYSTTYYSFIINNTNALTISVGIIIVFPEQIRISPSLTQCYINSTALASANCIIDISNSTADKVTLTIPNSSPISASGLVNTNITITSVINPLSLRQTSSFSISLVGNTGQIIQALSQGITVTMANLLSAFTFFNILTTNNYTMALANYTIQYQLPLDIVTIYGASSSYISSGIKIVVILPQQYGCMGTNSSTNKPCMVSSTQSQILSTSLASTPANSTISFMIPSVTNPSTVTVSSSITVRLYLGVYLSIQYQYNGFSTFQPSLLTYSITFSNYYIGQSNDIEIIINSISNWRTHNSSRYLLIRPPSQFSVDVNLKISTNQPTNIISSTISSGTLQSVKISDTILTTNESITLSNILNPSLLSQIPTSKFSIQYRDKSTNALIAISDISTDIRFNLICTFPCRTCLTGNSSSCVTCYSNTSAIPQKYYDINGKTCLTACLGGQFLSLISNDFTCYACASSCLTCLNVSDNCTSCSVASSTFLYTGSSKCISQCPPQYYENSVGQTCTLCSSPCLFCTGATGTTCTLCIATNVLTIYQNGTTTCSLNCPTGNYNNSNICANCSTNCTSCLSTNQCTACISNYYLYSGSCLASCPSGLYISIASGNISCEACVSPCLSCVNYSTYCFSCNTSNLSSNQFLFVNVSINTSTCSAGCPPQYYSNQYYICNPCVSPCLLCTSATDCSSCISGYYLYSATKVCYSVCPINTILQIATQDCRQCTSPCLECVGSISNCLSCIQGYFLDQSLNVCNLTCNLPYFAINRTCSRCAFPCSTCTPLQPYSCTGCKSGYLLFGTSCYLSLCPDGSYKTSSNTTCAVCTSGCLTCITSSSTCLSCYPGLYLYQQSCIPSCPTTPIIYFQYQMQCIACQPQCTTCISSPIQCTSCSDPSLYFNQVTRQCTSNCVSPFYPSLDASNPSIKICVKCKLPCKTCTSTQTKCSTCHNGLYLYNQQCLQNCPLSTYSDMNLNTCDGCAPNCLICSSSSSCTSCADGSLTFQGSCYITCPTQAPYPYLSKYCRNCLLDYCILCEGSNAVCLLCQPGYYLFEDKCLGACPQNYEPDEITSSLCLQTSNSVLLNFLKKLQKFKVYLMPGVIFFFLSLLFLMGYIFGLGQCICFCSQENTNANFLVRPHQIIWINTLQAVIGIPQTISLIAYLTYLILHPEGYYHSNLFNIFMYVIFILFYVFNIIHFILVIIALKKDRIFAQWLKYGIKDEEDKQKNYKRYIVIMTIALIFNRKVFYILFSGLWRIPITCCQISVSTIEQMSKKLKIITILEIILVEVPMIAYTISTLFIQNYSISNYKLFYGAIDLSVLNVICIIIEMIFIAKKFLLPSVYKKYILQKVSIESLPGLTQKVFEQLPNDEDEDDPHNLHRSNSAEALRQSQQMKAVQYLSVFDANEYEDPQYFQSSLIENAIQQGRFKKKNLKKKKKKYGVQLDIISEDSQQQQQQFKAKEKNKKNKKVEKKKKIGYLNNFIYWQPPQKERKKKPQKEFKAHQKQIMERIKQKQSDFDTITRNDIIFREEALEFNSSHDSDPDFQIQETRRALNYQYQAFINKNYAKKRHLG